MRDRLTLLASRTLLLSFAQSVERENSIDQLRAFNCPNGNRTDQREGTRSSLSSAARTSDCCLSTSVDSHRRGTSDQSIDDRLSSNGDQRLARTARHPRANSQQTRAAILPCLNRTSRGRLTRLIGPLFQEMRQIRDDKTALECRLSALENERRFDSIKHEQIASECMLLKNEIVKNEQIHPVIEKLQVGRLMAFRSRHCVRVPIRVSPSLPRRK